MSRRERPRSLARALSRLRLRLRRLRLRRLVRRGGCGRALGGLSLGRKVRHVEVLARGRLRQRR